MPAISAGEVAERAEQAAERLRDCDLCPRQCHVDRTGGETGLCGVGPSALVSSYGPHFGEERPLVGNGGSGTVFFAGCNLGCIFCQNDDISHGLSGREVDAGELATIFLSVQENGCHNLNLVTPSHVVPQWLEALALTMEGGFSLPVVYNTGGYDAVSTLQLLDGVVDIYMPDLKFMNGEVAERLAQAPDYPKTAKQAIHEMHRQVGDLEIDAHGVARRGLLVRHLVMPHNLAGSDEALRFLADEISRSTYVNIMGQYHPCHEAWKVNELRRRPTANEMDYAFEAAGRHGLTRLD